MEALAIAVVIQRRGRRDALDADARAGLSRIRTLPSGMASMLIGFCASSGKPVGNRRPGPTTACRQQGGR